MHGVILLPDAMSYDTFAYLMNLRQNDQKDSVYHMILPCSAVGNVSGYRCLSDCRSRGHEYDPGQVPGYFCGDSS